MNDIEITDLDERLVIGWCSVEIQDSQGDIVPVDELRKAMIKFMDRGGDLVYGHSNKKVGKVLNWWIDKHPETGRYGVKILAKINRGYKIDDAVWEMIKNGKIKGFSIGGTGEQKILKKKENGVEKEISILKDIELTEISVVEKPANQYAIIEEINYFAKGESEINVIDILKEFNIAGEDINKFYEKKESIILCNICKSVKDKFRDSVAISIYGKRYGELSDDEKKKVKNVLDKFDEMFAVLGVIFDNVEEDRRGDEESEIDVRKPFAGFKNWDECMREMRRRYDEETAKKVCGKLKAEYEKSMRDIMKTVKLIKKSVSEMKKKYGV